MTEHDTGRSWPSIWDSLIDDPVEATNLRMRSMLVFAIARRVGEWGLTQKEAAARLGISQPRLNQLLKDRFEAFSLDSLVRLLEPAGLEIEFNVVPAP